MISKLTGILDSVSAGSLILDVGGVGYQVFCSNNTLTQCGQKGDPLSLLIDTHVREDHIHLFGFMAVNEQEWFRLLISVQGVGAKAAMAILAACPAEQLGFAIASGDKAGLTRAEGVGPKLAARIITELKDKASKMDLQGEAKPLNASPPDKAGPENVTTGLDQDAVSALVNLGYQRTDAYAAVLQVKKKKANDNDVSDLQDLIKLALKELSI